MIIGDNQEEMVAKIQVAPLPTNKLYVYRDLLRLPEPFDVCEFSNLLLSSAAKISFFQNGLFKDCGRVF